jgi:hypothetical protein
MHGQKTIKKYKTQFVPYNKQSRFLYVNQLMNDIQGNISVVCENFAKQMLALLVCVLNRLYVAYVTASVACTHNKYNVDNGR